MDFSHFTKEVEEFEDIVDSFVSQMKDITEGKIPKGLEEKDDLKSLSNNEKLDARKVDSVKLPVQIAKTPSETSVISVPKAAEPHSEPGENSRTKETMDKLKLNQPQRTSLDYSRFDNITDEDSDDEQVVPSQPSPVETKKELVPPKRLPLPPTSTEILHILSNEHRMAGNDAFQKRDFAAAEESYTLALETCLHPTKAMISEFKQRGRKGKEEDPFAFINKFVGDPDAVVPESAVYNNRALVRVKMGKWKEAKEDCTKALETVIKAAGNNELDVNQFDTAVKALTRKVLIERELRLLEDAEASLNRLHIYLKKYDSFILPTVSRPIPLVDAEETFRTLRSVQKELHDAESESSIAAQCASRRKQDIQNLRSTLEKFRTIAKSLEGKITGRKKEAMDDITAYICSMIVEGQHGAVVFRVSKGFEAVLEEGVVTPSTLGWVLDIVIAAVSSGRLSTNYQASTSPNVREVTKRIYLLLKTFLATPETDRKGLTEMMMQLFAFCAPDVYFLDYITQSKFMHTPDGAHVWREMMQEMLMQVQDGDLDGSRLPHVACLLTFTKYLMKHGPSGPHAVFNAWNISPVALLRVADQYIASTVEISSLELDVAENMLGELACGALISVLNAKPVSKISPGPRDMISTISMIVKITRRILRGKNTAMTRNHHIARLHEVKQSIYHLIYKLSSEARTCDADFEVRNEMVPLVFSALVDLRELDESLEDSNDHVKWLILTLSNLVSDLPVECSEQLAVRWDELAIDEILKGAFNQFVYVPETDSSTKVCHAAIKILHSWLKISEDNSETWERREGFGIFAQLMNEIIRRRKIEINEYLGYIEGNLAVCVELCTKKPANAQLLFEAGIMEAAIELLRMERATKNDVVKRNLAVACGKICSNYEPAKLRFKELKGFELIHSMGNKILK